jgi:hypothetical protein
VDGSDDSEESGDDDDADAHAETGSKPTPKSKPMLGKRKAEFSSRKPKRTYSPVILRDFWVIVRCPGGPRIEVEYENETEVAPRTRVVAAGW